MPHISVCIYILSNYKPPVSPVADYSEMSRGNGRERERRLGRKRQRRNAEEVDAVTELCGKRTCSCVCVCVLVRARARRVCVFVCVHVYV